MTRLNRWDDPLSMPTGRSLVCCLCKLFAHRNFGVLGLSFVASLPAPAYLLRYGLMLGLLRSPSRCAPNGRTVHPSLPPNRPGLPPQHPVLAHPLGLAADHHSCGSGKVAPPTSAVCVCVLFQDAIALRRQRGMSASAAWSMARRQGCPAAPPCLPCSPRRGRQRPFYFFPPFFHVRSTD